jgi:hypothetical protein
MNTRPPVDILYLIRARIDSGATRGAPQLTKDVRVLKKAAAEIERLRAEVARIQAQLGTGAPPQTKQEN